jgi:hypothetical protein
VRLAKDAPDCVSDNCGRQRFVRKRVGEYREQGVFCNLAWLTWVSDYQRHRPETSARAAPLLIVGPFLPPTDGLGVRDACRKPRGWGSTGQGFCRLYGSSPGLIARLFPATPANCKQGRQGGVVHAFIVRDVGPFELVRVHGGGSDGQ